jgi:hypothetical protein
VNNITIINQTTEIRQINREQRNVAGREQTVVTNRGPDVSSIEKVTGKKLTAVAVVEAQRRTVIPPTVRRAKEKAPATQEIPKPAPPLTAPELPNKPAPSEKTLTPTKSEIVVPKSPSEQKLVSPPLEKKVVSPPSQPERIQPNKPANIPPGHVEKPSGPPPAEKKIVPAQPQPSQVQPPKPPNVRRADKEKPKDRDKDTPK